MTTISIGDILKTDVDPTTGSIVVQTGRVLSGEADRNPSELWSIPGIISRPTPVIDQKDACQHLSYDLGDNKIIFATRDVRTQLLAGSLGEGETVVHAPGLDGKSQGRVLLKNDGSVNIYTTKGNAVGATGLGIFVDAANDTITISTSQGAAIQLAGRNINILTPDGSSIALGTMLNMLEHKAHNWTGLMLFLVMHQ